MATCIMVQTLREMVSNLGQRKPELASRAERAAQIIVTRDIKVDANGQYHIESQSKPGSFHLVSMVGGKGCDCIDFTRSHAPQGWCKHLIAVAILRKAGQWEQDKARTAQLERKGQEFHRLVEKGTPVMAALAKVKAAA